MLALECEIKSAKQQDHFLNYDIELVITGYSGEEVRQMLSAASNGAFQRAMVQALILKNMAAASKVEQKEGITRFRNFLVTEGFAMLAEHKSPRFIQDRMNSFLDPSIHYTIDQRGGKGGGQRRRKAA